ncbi:hypothetical protein TrRE_jg3257 [Triparma retinervis]|uniref:Uncharacterized protein n=1 Tax=Triparma retinervis TaxID=2557542 RepID=A0A9W6ZA01_9STRA|nr:hypothetical protein TrRE_jg3257 [Triparma retinervis]
MEEVWKVNDEDLPFTRKHKEEAIKGTVVSYIRPKNNTEDELIESVIVIDVEYEDGKEFLTIMFPDGLKERLTENQLYERSQPEGWYDIKDLRDGEVRMRSHDLSKAETMAAMNDGKDPKLKTMMIKVPDMLTDFIMRKYEPNAAKKKENERRKKGDEVKRWIAWAKKWRSKAANQDLTDVNMIQKLEELELDPDDRDEQSVGELPHVIYLSNEGLPDREGRITYRDTQFGTLLPHKNREKDARFLDELEGNEGNKANSWHNAMKRGMQDDLIPQMEE